MFTKEAADRAYQYGVYLALQQAGLIKTALVREAGSALMSGVRSAGGAGARAGQSAGGWLSANPAIQRALIGAGVGGAVGGATDIGAGRGALAGGLAGAGSALGQGMGQRAVRQGYKSELAAAARGTKPLAGQAGHGQLDMFAPRVAPMQGPVRSGDELASVIKRYTGGRGAQGLGESISRGGNIGGVGLGALAGGGALMASQPPPPKPWYAGLMGG